MIRRPIAVCAALSLVAAIVALGSGSGRLTAILLCSLQVAGLGALLVAGRVPRRGWRTASFVLAAGWVPLFTIPSFAYAIDPSLLDRGSPVEAIALVDASLFALLLGMAAIGAGDDDVAPLATVEPVATRDRVTAAWFAAGVAALAGVMIANGGPVHYLSNLDKTGAMNAGLFYVIWVALAVSFAPLVYAAASWAAGRAIGRAAIAWLVVGTLLLALTGARAFVAVSALQILLTYALLYRPLRVSRIAPAILAVGLLLVFGLGIVKRYQGYNHSGQARIGFSDYVRTRAGHELVASYVNNYVDTVRLIAIAREVTPSSAPFEGARPFIRFLVKPIPRPLRPEVARDPQLQRDFAPAGPYTFAVPLQATVYLAGGVPLLVALFVLLGAAVRRLDVWLAAPRTRSFSVELAAIALVIQIPVFLRSGLPEGLTFLVVEVLGTWAVARTSVTRSIRAGRLAPSRGGSARPGAGSDA